MRRFLQSQIIVIPERDDMLNETYPSHTMHTCCGSWIDSNGGTGLGR